MITRVKDKKNTCPNPLVIILIEKGNSYTLNLKTLLQSSCLILFPFYSERSIITFGDNIGNQEEYCQWQES
jgi:hypothetical protein